ncbi:Subtilisin BL [Calidithermus terrae]|uniref:Subtilisin BL n=1 Tax=Calidithermus terrae TaxID=1408545 RepID=A0A399F7S1_9DEIN|nr:S8 family serine peptidase [Calidithermus terrae]RIH90942.1 Subtilisin BL [Calidithermus terrae]
MTPNSSHPPHGQAPRKMLGRFLAWVLPLALAAGCNPATPPATGDVPLSANQPRADFVLTVPLAGSESRSSLEARYGGKALVWESGRYAMLGLDSKTAEAKKDVIVADNLTLEPNDWSFLSGGQAAWMSGSSTIWAGGTSTIWAGGTSTIWAGGTSTIWAGGEFTWMPENTAIWKRVRLEQGHRLAKNLGYGVKVAVIDTGIDLEHPALKEALAPAGEWWDFYGNDPVPQEEGVLGQGGYGHGTNVAGIVRQVAPRATLLPLRVLGPDGYGDVVAVAAAINWAVVKGAKVINLSLGSDQKHDAIEQAIRAANAKGVLVVASTGNTGDTNVTFPASTMADDKNGWKRLSVTSVNLADAKSGFATYGKSVELAAPGENVYGPAPGLRKAAWTGTSMAAPMASGALALALGEELEVPAANLADELRVRSSDIYNNGLNEAYKDQVGKGRLDLEEFLRNVLDD